MTSWRNSLVPIAIRIKNARFDGMVTGFLHSPPKCKFSDPGGMVSGSFIVDQWLGYRSDIMMDYSRVYFLNKQTGDVLFEGDVSHPGRSASDDGSLVEVVIEGGVARMSDWSGPRIYVDRDMQAWVKTANSVVATTLEAGDDRGGSADEAMTLAFPSDQHVETNSRCEAGYYRIREAGQELGRFNYAWDAGQTSGVPGWQFRTIVTPPSTVPRTQSLSTAGSGGSGAVVGGSIPVGANVVFLQLIWTGGSSNTGGSGADIVWVSTLDPVVVARLRLKDGTFKTSGYTDSVTCANVWEDMLGSAMMSGSFDGANAQIDAGTSYQIEQFAFPNGVTPQQIADNLMTFEQACTYMVGASDPVTGKYSFKWMLRTEVPRYEFLTWIDGYSAPAQDVDQYDVAVARWKSPAGTIKQTVTTQSIPEMAAVGRSRRIWQDLTETTSSAANAGQANLTLLNDHRFPVNGGKLVINRTIVDQFTGRQIQPFEIQPGYIARVSGVNPTRDALNTSPRNGSTLCRIVTNDYDGASHTASLDLDSEPWSMFKAIARANQHGLPHHRDTPRR